MEKEVEANMKLYSYADNLFFATGFIVLDILDMEYKYYHCSYEYHTSIVPLFNAVTYYNNLDIKRYILMVKQALLIIDEDRILMCPFQIRSNGFIVYYCT